MALQGKGWYIWQVPRCEGGSAEVIADRAAAAGLTHVLVKVAERTFAFGFDKFGKDLVSGVAEALHARGIQVWGWHYVYGDDPASEARIAAQRVLQLNLDGYVIDAEAQYKQAGKAAAARTFMTHLRDSLPSNTLVALSSYRYPALHSQIPWSAFLEKCDLSMPQVYWEQAHNPDQQLVRCLNEFSNPSLVGFARPVVPTGSAYRAGNWRPTAQELTTFLAKAKELGLAAANYYSWDFAGAPHNTDLWDAVSEFDWPASQDVDIADIVNRYFVALNTGDVGQVLSLYQANVGHVTSQRTLVGLEELSRWYTELLTTTLPGARFTPVEISGSGNSRHFRWIAEGSSGRIVDGDDTFGLLDGQIQYHYTFYTITPGT